MPRPAIESFVPTLEALFHPIDLVVDRLQFPAQLLELVGNWERELIPLSILVGVFGFLK